MFHAKQDIYVVFEICMKDHTKTVLHCSLLILLAKIDTKNSDIVDFNAFSDALILTTVLQKDMIIASRKSMKVVAGRSLGACGEGRGGGDSEREPMNSYFPLCDTTTRKNLKRKASNGLEVVQVRRCSLIPTKTSNARLRPSSPIKRSEMTDKSAKSPLSQLQHLTEKLDNCKGGAGAKSLAMFFHRAFRRVRRV